MLRVLHRTLGALRNTSLLCALILLAGAAVIAMIYWRRDAEIERALENYRAESAAETRATSSAVEENFEHLYQALRTIARLPGIRGIDRHAVNFDENARRSVQELYNNLAQNVEISEVYVVPADIDPDRIDPVIGRPEEPIIMFDQLIVGQNKDQGETRPSAVNEVEETESFEHVEEVEIYEYRLMRKQIAHLREVAPVESSFGGLDYPAISGPEVITCDNRNFSPSNPDDKARSGIVYSVPFYGMDGKLKGMISTIILSTALSEWMPSHGFVLTNEDNKLEVGDAALSRIERSHKPVRSTLYASTANLNVRDLSGTWSISASREDAAFWARGDVTGAQSAANIATLLVSTLIIALVFALRVQQRLLALNAGRKDELDRLVQVRTTELDEARRKAEAASLAKSDFLAMMSHEIRTPMNGVLGMTAVLMDNELSVEQRQRAATIRDSGESLLAIINDVLDFSKLDGKAMEFECAPFNIHSLLEYSGEIVAPRANTKAINLVMDLHRDLPQYVCSDAGRLRQIVLNLLSNAIKFTEHGSVTLRAQVHPATDGKVTLRIEVVDTGIGISADRLHRLFKSFSQADASISRKFGGTGLGLAISKKLAEGLGGMIGVDSAPGKGSTFWFEVPVTVANAEQVANVSSDVKSSRVEDALGTISAINRPLRILVAEDNATNQLVVRSMLAKLGITTEIAGNGLEAVEAVKRATFDAILMDVHMPEMDGLAATRAIRSMSGPCARVPIIAVTANAFDSDIVLCRAAGMNAHLGKPFRRDDLIVALADVIRCKPEFDVNTTSITPTADAAPTIDWNIIESFRTDSGDEVLRLLIDTYLADAAQMLDQLALVSEKTVTPEVVRLAHSLKSASATVGAVALSNLAAHIETALISGSTVDMTQDTVRLKALFATYRARLVARGLAA